MTSPRIAFYTRKGCHLCDQILPEVRNISASHGLEIQIIDIDRDAALVAKHGNWVPVIEIDGRVRARGIISPGYLRREIALAAQQGVPEVQKLRIAVAIVFNEAGQMLVNKRPEGSYFGGWWEWPGGKCELGESPLNTAKRELKEEIGIEGEAWAPYRRQQSHYPGRVVNLHFFTAKLKDGSQAHANSMEHQWLRPEAVSKIQFLEANLEVLSSFISA